VDQDVGVGQLGNHHVMEPALDAILEREQRNRFGET